MRHSGTGRSGARGGTMSAGWRSRAGAVLLLAAAVCAPATIDAQWVKHRTPGIPRTAAGTPNLAAPAPRTADGKPDFSGMWITAPANALPCGRGLVECGIELPMSREGGYMGASLPGGLPYQPWAEELVKKNMATSSKDDPHGLCLPDTFLRAYGLPHIVKFVQTPQLLIALEEYNVDYRQIFLDGRALPEDPTHSWKGYSVGRWEGDTLVVDSIGFRDDLWLDFRGSPLTSAGKVRERITRPDFGHLNIDVTVDDPKAYTRPWTVRLQQQIIVDTETIDEVCLENEKFMRRLRGTP
ncbi:MAG TPA: hypothetical protein VFO58_18815 [Vicinamibacterales bacterium]|nr:hypothetical protein [Vicinamibacterales bacterium]